MEPSHTASIHQQCQSVRFEKDTRYYNVRLEQDLLDDWVVVITYGRINSRLGQNKVVAFAEFEHALIHFKKICTIRQKRHYRIIEKNKRPFSSPKNNNDNQSLYVHFHQKEKNKNKFDKCFHINSIQKSYLNQLFDS
jgi:predicted DNA-binding WGR domain protein